MSEWMEEIDEQAGAIDRHRWDVEIDEVQELKDLEQAYVDHTLAGYKLLGIISEKRKRLYRRLCAGFIGEAHATIENRCIRITVEKLPEKVEVWKYLGMQYAKRIHDYWQSGIKYALLELDKKQSIMNMYENCSVIIRVLKDSNRDWDIDNFHIKYIIDGIRYAGVIPDDSWYNIQYLVLGKDSKGINRTEIYLMDSKDFIKVYQSLS